MIISNPPYITDEAMERLDAEVKDFDPDLALRGGEDGMTAYNEIIHSAPSYLCEGGWLMFEIGYDQGRTVPALMKQHGFSDVEMWQDLAGHDRYVKGCKI